LSKFAASWHRGERDHVPGVSGLGRRWPRGTWSTQWDARHDTPLGNTTDATEPAVDRPLHSLAQMTTYELSGYRRQLERAIAFFDSKDPVPPARDQLQATLDMVIAEQEERARIAYAR
jgi:hypothetical protein